MLQPTTDRQSLVSATDTFAGGIRFGAVPSNEGIFRNVKHKRRSPCGSTLGKAVDDIGADSSCVPRQSELFPRTLGHGSCDVEVCRREVEEITALFRAQYDAVKSRIISQKRKNMLKHPCRSPALSAERHSIQCDANQCAHLPDPREEVRT